MTPLRRIEHRSAAIKIALAGLALSVSACWLSLPDVSTPAAAGENELSGAEGHPRERFPLTVNVAPLGEATLEAASRRAVRDWNAVFRSALSLTAFVEVERAADAQVVVTIEPRATPRLMGETRLTVDAAGLIELPVRVVVVLPEARGQTAPEVVFYQVLAHELGHGLGLAHTRDSRSLMCCVRGSIDFSDPATRQAYVDARRNPDLDSVRTQLREHYERFWRAR